MLLLMNGVLCQTLQYLFGSHRGPLFPAMSSVSFSAPIEPHLSLLAFLSVLKHDFLLSYTLVLTFSSSLGIKAKLLVSLLLILICVDIDNTPRGKIRQTNKLFIEHIMWDEPDKVSYTVFL